MTRNSLDPQLQRIRHPLLLSVSNRTQVHVTTYRHIHIIQRKTYLTRKYSSLMLPDTDLLVLYNPASASFSKVSPDRTCMLRKEILFQTAHISHLIREEQLLCSKHKRERGRGQETQPPPSRGASTVRQHLALRVLFFTHHKCTCTKQDSALALLSSGITTAYSLLLTKMCFHSAWLY